MGPLVEAEPVIDEMEESLMLIEQRGLILSALSDKSQQLEVITSKYGRLQKRIEYQEHESGLILKDEHIRRGAHFFVHKN